MAARQVTQYLDRVYPGRRGTLLHRTVLEAGHVATTGALIAGAGYLANRYRDKHVAGMPVDLAGGLGGTFLALLAAGTARGKLAKLVPLVRAAGHAGLYSWAHTYGSGMGALHGGVAPRAALPGAPKQKVAGAVFGMAKAPTPGDWLSDNQLAALARG